MVLPIYTNMFTLTNSHITYNSALDASPPKASKLPDVILSSMDLLAKTHTSKNTQQLIDLNKGCKEMKSKHTCDYMHTHQTGCL